jgi:serine protease Do
VEQARQGVVVIQRQGRPLALGAVLEGDGRIITALSPLTHGNSLSARYPDGAVVPLKLAHADRAWDLALLAPQPPASQPPRKAGVKAASQPSFTGLQIFGLGGAGKPLPLAPISLQLSEPLLGGDGVALPDSYTLSGAAPSLGAPIVNASGEVVALVARACPAGSAAPASTKPTPCTPAPYGAPVGALKRFLKRIPAEATWLGIEGAGEEAQGVRGVRVVSVIPGSPAASAGLRPGQDLVVADLIVAVDGTPVSTPGDLNEAVRARVVGDSIELLLFGLGRYRHISVKPRPAPELTAPPYTAPIPAKHSTPNPYR